MMLFNSLFLLSLIFYCCKSTAAATLAVSPVKRGRLIDPIECPGPVYADLPFDFPQFPSLLEMCASRAMHPRNLECICAGETLICGSSRRYTVRRMIDHCFNYCICGDDTQVDRDDHTKVLNYAADTLELGMGGPSIVSPWSTPSNARNRPTGNTGNNPIRGHACSNTCSSVSRGCPYAYTGQCTCYAAPVNFFFWHISNCGAVYQISKRDLAQQRRGYYINATAQYAPPKDPNHNATAAAFPSPPPNLSAQLGSGLLPFPCNASYVSFACGNSPDGIVHEPPHHWLGALLPENATQLPPVPKEFLRIHGGK